MEHGVRLSKIPTISAENPVVQAYLRTIFSLRPGDVLSMGTEPTSFSRALASRKDQPCVLLPAMYGRNSIINEKTLRETLVTGEIHDPNGKQTRSSYQLGALPVLLSDGTSCPLGSDCGIPIDAAEGDFDLAACAAIAPDVSCQETYWSSFVAFVAMHWDELAERIQDHMRSALEESAARAYMSEDVTVLGAMSWAAELIQRFYHELSIDEDGLFDAVWKEFVIDALEEGAAQYAAPDGLTDIFFCVARDLIRLKRIPCYRTAQCFDAVPHGVAYLHKCRSLEERRAAIRAVAGYTKVGLKADPEETRALRADGIVKTPEDLGIDPARANRSLLAAKNVRDLVKWSGGLYQPPGKFKNW